MSVFTRIIANIKLIQSFLVCDFCGLLYIVLVFIIKKALSGDKCAQIY